MATGAAAEQNSNLLLKNSKSSRSNTSSMNSTHGTKSKNDKSGSNSSSSMAFIQTTIRRTVIAILVFAVLVRLRMMIGSFMFQRQQ